MGLAMSQEPSQWPAAELVPPCWDMQKLPGDLQATPYAHFGLC